MIDSNYRTLQKLYQHCQNGTAVFFPENLGRVSLNCRWDYTDFSKISLYKTYFSLSLRWQARLGGVQKKKKKSLANQLYRFVTKSPKS